MSLPQSGGRSGGGGRRDQARPSPRPDGPALGVSTDDFDATVHTHVATTARRTLWTTTRGTFEDTASRWRCVNAPARRKRSWAWTPRFDNDGDEDLFLTTGCRDEISTSRRPRRPDRKGGLGMARRAGQTGRHAWLDSTRRSARLSRQRQVSTIEAQARARIASVRMTTICIAMRARGVRGRVGSAGAPFPSLHVPPRRRLRDIDTTPTRHRRRHRRRPASVINDVAIAITGSITPGTAAQTRCLGARVKIVKADGSTLWRRVLGTELRTANYPRVGGSPDARRRRSGPWLTNLIAMDRRARRPGERSFREPAPDKRLILLLLIPGRRGVPQIRTAPWPLPDTSAPSVRADAVGELHALR